MIAIDAAYETIKDKIKPLLPGRRDALDSEVLEPMAIELHSLSRKRLSADISRSTPPETAQNV